MNSNYPLDPTHTMSERWRRGLLIAAAVSFVVAFVLLFAIAAHSQEAPAAAPAVDRVGVAHGAQRDAATGQSEVPHETPHANSVSAGFFVLNLASGIATAADCSSTNHLVQAGPQFRETSLVLGARPSPLRISAVCGAGFAAYTSAAYALKRGRRDRLWVVPPAIAIIVHSISFAHNRGMYPHANPTTKLTRLSATTAPSR